MPVHVAEMYELEHNDPDTCNALCEGDFVAQHSLVPFTCLFNDQSLEQQIKQLKKYGPGIVGVSQDEAAMDRLVTIAPYLATLAKLFMEDFPKHKANKSRTERHQLQGGKKSDGPDADCPRVSTRYSLIH